MTMNPKALRSEAFTDIGQVIKRDTTAILERWTQRATQEQPHAIRVHHRVLLDHLQTLLDELGNSLVEEGNGDVAHHRRVAMQHGEQRWDTGWSLPEVVRDYQILRLVLADYLEETLDRALRSREHQALDLALDEAVAASVSVYVNHNANQIRSVEKQKTERVQEAADHLRRHAEQLQEAHRHKDEFLAVMSHELRNPLAPLRNALHVLTLDGSEPTVKWARQLMERQVHVLSRLVDDLLDISRIARGKIALRRERVDLTRLVRDAAEDHRGSLAEAGVALTVATPPEVLCVLGEATRLAQVLGNLLHNARKFTDKGGQVTVSLTALDSDRAEILVSDTGIGMSAATLAHVFDAYAQGEHQTDRRHGGLGLGLALVKGLVELHGGRVEARSDGLGRGSAFSLVLPLEK